MERELTGCGPEPELIAIYEALKVGISVHSCREEWTLLDRFGQEEWTFLARFRQDELV